MQPVMKREDGNLSMKKSIVDEGKSDRTGEAAEAHISRKSVSPLSSSNDNRQANSSIAEKEQAISEKNELVGKENHTQRKSPNKDVIQAAVFLNHPSLEKVSAAEKEIYIRSKGLSSADIQAAKEIASSGYSSKNNLDNIWNAENNKNAQNKRQLGQSGLLSSDGVAGTHHTANFESHSSPMQNNSYRAPLPQSYPIDQNGNMNESDEPELPNVIIPMTIGGVLALYGMASLRWLNGSDFVLFPPSNTTITSKAPNNNAIISSRETLGEESIADVGVENIDGYDEKYNGLLENNIMDLEEVDDYSAEEELCEEDFIQDSVLSQDLQALTLAIEKYSDIQERTLRTKLDETARCKTNSAMDLLIKKRNNKDDTNIDDSNSMKLPRQDSGDDRISASEMQMLMLLSEMKCELKIMTNQVSSNILADKADSDFLSKLDMIGGQLRSIETRLSHRKKNESNDTVGLDELKPSTNLSSTSVETDKDIVNDQGQIESSQSHIIAGQHSSEQSVDSSSSFQSCPNDTIIASASKDECQNLDTIETKNNHEDSAMIMSKTEAIEVGIEATERAIERMTSNNDRQMVKSSCQMLFLYVSNLVKNPSSKQYQKIYTTNKTFKNKIEKVKFAKDVLLSIGFKDQDSFLEWEERGGKVENEQTNILQEAVRLLQSAQAELK